MLFKNMGKLARMIKGLTVSNGPNCLMASAAPIPAFACKVEKEALSFGRDINTRIAKD